MSYCKKCGGIKKSAWDDIKQIQIVYPDSKKDIKIYNKMLNTISKYWLYSFGLDEATTDFYKVFNDYSIIKNFIKNYSQKMKYLKINERLSDSDEKFNVYLDIRMKYKNIIQLGLY